MSRQTFLAPVLHTRGTNRGRGEVTQRAEEVVLERGRGEVTSVLLGMAAWHAKRCAIVGPAGCRCLRIELTARIEFELNRMLEFR